MDEVIQRFNKSVIRYLLIGGQAVRLEGLPRFSMDWDSYIPPRDLDNIRKINELLAGDIDVALEPLGPKGENFVQTYQTRWGILQFHLGGHGLPPFDDAEKAAVQRATEIGTLVRCLNPRQLLESKRRSGRPQDQSDILFLEEKLGLC